jgi:hypothetical protein
LRLALIFQAIKVYSANSYPWLAAFVFVLFSPEVKEKSKKRRLPQQHRLLYQPGQLLRSIDMMGR